MLKNTFIHIPGIGKDSEKKLWENSICTWEDLRNNISGVSKSKNEKINYYINKSIENHKKKKFEFFLENMPTNIHWRAYNELKEKCCFLDIETTGLNKHSNEITVIGLYDGIKSKFFINGINLNKFPAELEKYSMIVSFNGRCFDIPFINAKFPDINTNKFHIDLRFAMKEIGFSGGLKKIEKEIGINRESDLVEIDGFEAVRLWYKYKAGDDNALDLLIKYNQADIENLKVMMDFAFKKLKEKHFINNV